MVNVRILQASILSNGVQNFEEKLLNEVLTKFFFHQYFLLKYSEIIFINKVIFVGPYFVGGDLCFLPTLTTWLTMIQN